MQKSLSWENNRISANQGISRILWNPKDHYRIHKCPPPIPILSQFHSVHTLISYCLNIHLNIITPPMPGSPKCSLSHRFIHQNPVYASPVLHTRYLPCLTHSSRVLSPEQHWVNSTDHSASHYASSDPLLPFHS